MKFLFVVEQNPQFLMRLKYFLFLFTDFNFLRFTCLEFFLQSLEFKIISKLKKKLTLVTSIHSFINHALLGAVFIRLSSMNVWSGMRRD